MGLFKNKFFIPVCLAGALIGYGAAEWAAPRVIKEVAVQHPEMITQNIYDVLGQQAQYYRRTQSGNYLAGQFAQRHKDWDNANDFIGDVLSKNPEDATLQRHSMVLNMASGNIEQAIALAKKILPNNPDNILAVLFLSLEHFKNEDYVGAKKILSELNGNSISAFLVPILKLWTNTPQNTFDIQSLPVSSFYAHQILLLGKFLGKEEKALQYALNAYKTEENDIRDLEKTADLLALYGKQEDALKLLEVVSKSGFETENIKEKISRLKDKKDISDLIKTPDVQTSAQGIAVVFSDMSEILFREYSDDSAIIFAQMALYLDNNREEARMMIGNIFVRHDRLNEAITAFKKITPDSEFYNTAQRQVSDIYAEQKQNEKAISILNSLYENDDDINALIQIGDIYRYEEDFIPAAAAYSKVIDLWDNVPEEYWHVLYARGMVFERLKEHKKAEEDLIKALEFRPNHPYLLNYLGYSWVDQGLHLDKSLGMLKKASLSKPDDGYIADSLGWVYYKLNDIAEAVIHLERAVELLPYDATINDHLGDAYWHAGRKNEAKFQWRRAINYSEDKDIDVKEKAQQKIISGLEPVENQKDEELTKATPENYGG